MPEKAAFTQKNRRYAAMNRIIPPIVFFIVLFYRSPPLLPNDLRMPAR